MGSNEEFIKKNKVMIVDDDKNTKLHYAAALGNVEEIKKTIANGQKLDPVNYLGWTPLMMAVRTGNLESVELLLNSGADVTKKNKFGINVFLISVTCGEFQIVEKILNHLLCGGVSRQSLQRVLSPLSVAILFQQDQIFQYLLVRSFDPNIATPFAAITPLMFAAAVGNNKAFRQLLEFNADPTKKNHLGKTASDIIQTKNKGGIDIGNMKLKKTQMPLIIINQNSESPHLQLTPQMPPIVTAPPARSSNTNTPVIMTPGLSPISPFVFFGPDFTPSSFLNFGTPSAYYSNILNNTINSSSVFVSPQPICQNGYV